ncbi:2-oxoglutarate receptor 1 [Callorhinchus milii]|uniref:Oxoglutarate (alpha-ketoglutarate) receptor 1b n=1 Tax=Callorhinchus milii TaxID=7868 RepID=A0A4W3I1G3_CALMI|nr:2-oxoglutarate receptor 1 [Callorhinchus milii]XP_042190314.1 2-oxoglutarate receptor 1 [Callorhinchus milii]|eukprot:gi/632947351/ref/XP_007889005.1/ PREDICTED: 2-oxoglutarate receptor 1 [Callorhinchus milii]
MADTTAGEINSMNGSNVTNEPNDPCFNLDEKLMKYYLPVMYSFIFFIGLIGNIIAITVYIFKIRPWKSNTVINCNLILTDLLYVSSLPFIIYSYINSNSWKLGEFMCKFTRLIFYLNLYGSIMFLMCLSIFRFLVIIYPLRAYEVQKKPWAFLACCLVWLITIAEVLPMITFITLESKSNTFTCLDFGSSPNPEQLLVYSWILTVLGYLIPLLIIFICSLKIVYTLKKGPYVNLASKLRARRLIIVILIVFTICFLPLHLFRLLRLYFRLPNVTETCLTHTVNAIYIITRPIAALHTFCNLALYIIDDNFKQALISLFTCKSQSETRNSREHLHK